MYQVSSVNDVGISGFHVVGQMNHVFVQNAKAPIGTRQEKWQNKNRIDWQGKGEKVTESPPK
jgi:hypothetical protein